MRMDDFLSVKEVQLAAFKAGMAIRAECEQIIIRTAPLLAATNDKEKIKAILTMEIDAMFGRFSMPGE